MVPPELRVFPNWRPIWGELSRWPARRWVIALLATATSSLMMGIPTGVIPTPLYRRMTAVTWWDYPILAASALLIGLVVATYVRVGSTHPPARGSGRTLTGSLLSAFAIGCPICNKLVVALIGVSGALSYWAPLQPLLGLASLAFIGTTLVVRLRGLISCAAGRSPAASQPFAATTRAGS